jgi:flagellar motility protein MotE (MotC chaperone)
LIGCSGVPAESISESAGTITLNQVSSGQGGTDQDFEPFEISPVESAPAQAAVSEAPQAGSGLPTPETATALRQTQRALEARKTSLRKAREQLKIATEESQEMKEEIADLTKRLENAEREKAQYRNWWINEVQFTKLILAKVPGPNQDWDLVRTSQSHYLGRF